MSILKDFNIDPNASNEEIIEQIENLYDGEFMTPEFWKGRKGEIIECQDGESIKENPKKFYGWLSAPGYLDRTDPVEGKTIREVAEQLLEMYPPTEEYKEIQEKLYLDTLKEI